MRNNLWRLLVLLAVLITATVIFSDPSQAYEGGFCDTALIAAAQPQTPKVVDRPQAIKDKMAARGEQEKAKPVLKIVSPGAGEQFASSTVKVKLDLSGDLKGYHPMKDPATGMGNHIHVILDNQPYEAYYNLDQPFELRNVADGDHTLRVFASRPWHESYKNDGNFQMVRFSVKNGGGDATRPTTTGTGQQMGAATRAPAATPAQPQTDEEKRGQTPATPPEGKDMPASSAGAVSPGNPLLTYSRPKGEYKGADADAVMIDFWLSGIKLKNDGGMCRVRYTIDGGKPGYIDIWAPIWIAGLAAGQHQIKLELVDGADRLLDNGGYNSTTRTITITR